MNTSQFWARWLVLYVSIFLVSSLNAQVEPQDTMLIFLDNRIKERPFSSQLLSSRAYVYARNLRYKKALKDISAAIDLRKGNPCDTFHTFKSELHFLLGDERKALYEARMAYKIDSSKSNLSFMVEMAFLLKKYELCLRYAESYLSYFGDNSRVFYYRGVALLKTGDDRLAVHSIRLACSIASQEEDSTLIRFLSYFELARLHHRMEDWDSAIFHYEMALSFDTIIDGTNIFYHLGECLFYNADYEKTIIILTNHVTEYNWYNSLYYRARSHEYLQESRDAVEIYSIIIDEKDEENLKLAILHRGWCWKSLAEYEKALIDLKKARKKWFKESPFIYLDIGNCYFKMNDFEQACEYYNEGLGLENFENNEVIVQLKTMAKQSKCTQ